MIRFGALAPISVPPRMMFLLISAYIAEAPSSQDVPLPTDKGSFCNKCPYSNESPYYVSTFISISSLTPIRAPSPPSTPILRNRTPQFINPQLITLVAQTGMHFKSLYSLSVSLDFFLFLSVSCWQEICLPLFCFVFVCRCGILRVTCV